MYPAVPLPTRNDRSRPSLRAGFSKRLRPNRRLTLRLGALTLAVGIVVLAADLAVQRDIRSATRGYLYSSVIAAPSRPVALVFGAGYFAGGIPSPVLYDRLWTAAELYRRGKVKKLLVTGDNGTLYYNEVAVMRRTLMRMGVPGSDVIKDHAGFRTYDSCYRARDVFGVRSAVLVTQEFHLPRAVYLARRMGIDAVGVKADRRSYTRETSYRMREWLACSWSWVEMNVTHPRPRFLGPKIPLFRQVASAAPSGNARP